MPKKAAATRGGAQRNKPKGQKSIELVRQPVEEKGALQEKEVETEAEGSDEVVTTSASTVAPLDTQREGARRERVKNAIATAPKKQDAQPEETSSVTSTAPKGSAAARLAARRQTAQKAQQRTPPALVTAEHYAYVRRELIIIAILAFIMFSVIIILHFVPGIGG